MRLYDNTVLSTFERCERRAFFRHVLHWTGDQPTHALIFGLAWHNAMDAVWEHLVSDKDSRTTAQRAYDAFIKRWTEEGLPDPQSDHVDWEQFKARTPFTAIDMIKAYIEQRSSLIRQTTHLGIEKPFVVPLDEGSQVLYCGKLDKIRETNEGMVIVLDHKTSSQYSVRDTFQESFLEGFDPDSQVDGYKYAGLMLYGDRFYGVVIDGALVHSNKSGTVTGFRNVILRKRDSESFMDGWRWETAERVAQFERNLEVVNTYGAEHDYLPAFKKNTSACFDYNMKCPYLEFCKAWPNPLKTARERYVLEAPQGFKIEPWSPFSEIKLGELGITPEQVENLKIGGSDG
jgi:hypothetical protein